MGHSRSLSSLIDTWRRETSSATSLFYDDDAGIIANGTAIEHEFPEYNTDDDEVPARAGNWFSPIGP